MALRFFLFSGSPFAWKVWLALEHKGIDYDLELLSLDAGDLKTPEFRALNPRGKIPVIDHDGFVLYESAAIVEYLEEAFPHQGPSLWPADRQARALGRRLAAEAEGYLYPPIRRLMEELVWRREGQPDSDAIARARRQVAMNLDVLASSLQETFCLGQQPTLADYAWYPQLALLARIAARHPEADLAAAIPATLAGWRAAVEALPFFAKTYPPHWRP